MASLSLPVGSYALPEPKASVRRLINCFAETTPNESSQDSKAKDPPILLRRAPGIETFCDTGTSGPIRGLWNMRGVAYAVAGANLYSIDSGGTPTLRGTGIAGTGRVLMSDNSACLVIIIPGTFIGYNYVLATNTLSQITDANFLSLGALNLGFIDSYIVFLAVDGRQFYNADSQTVSGQGPLTFTGIPGTQFPREFGTDPFVGMTILDRTILMAGQLTSEAFIDAGNTVGSPFSSAPNNFLEIGCAAGQSIAKQDMSVIWLAQDKTVRRLNGSTPERISNHGIEAILEQGSVSDAYAITFAIAGHLMYVLTLPTIGRTLVYDCTTKQWHELQSYGYTTWRPYCAITAYGYQLVGDSQSGIVGKLNTSVFTEFGNVFPAQWIHQPIYQGHNRVRHQRLEIMLGVGNNPLYGQGSAPRVTLQISDDGGTTFRTMPMKDLGLTGHRQIRPIWYNLGFARDRVYSFTISDPVELWLTDVQLETLPSKN